jgi:hypothetical protein
MKPPRTAWSSETSEGTGQSSSIDERRWFLRTGFVVAAGSGLYSLAPTEALAASSLSSTSRAPVNSPMADEIKTCHSMCLHTALGYCFERGGRHAEQAHIRLMLNSARAVPDLGQLHVERLAFAWPGVRGVRRGVRSLRQELRASGRHARLRRRVPTLRREL